MGNEPSSSAAAAEVADAKHRVLFIHPSIRSGCGSRQRVYCFANSAAAAADAVRAYRLPRAAQFLLGIYTLLQYVPVHLGSLHQVRAAAGASLGVGVGSRWNVHAA